MQKGQALGLLQIAHEEGITLLFINLSNRTTFILDIHNSAINHKKNPLVHMAASNVEGEREEFHLTPKDCNLKSRIMVLNGKPLQLSDEGDVPKLEPVSVDAKLPIYVSPPSVAFVGHSEI
ncbi:hypothetical protein V2J09_000827 [Rumex salicifolius]